MVRLRFFFAVVVLQFGSSLGFGSFSFHWWNLIRCIEFVWLSCMEHHNSINIFIGKFWSVIIVDVTMIVDEKFSKAKERKKLNIVILYITLLANVIISLFVVFLCNLCTHARTENNCVELRITWEPSLSEYFILNWLYDNYTLRRTK